MTSVAAVWTLMVSAAAIATELPSTASNPELKPCTSQTCRGRQPAPLSHAAGFGLSVFATAVLARRHGRNATR